MADEKTHRVIKNQSLESIAVHYKMDPIEGARKIWAANPDKHKWAKMSGKDVHRQLHMGGNRYERFDQNKYDKGSGYRGFDKPGQIILYVKEVFKIPIEEKEKPEEYKTREVKQGDSIFSIALEEKVPWKKLWDELNGELKLKRGDPNILYPGKNEYHNGMPPDLVKVPKKDPGEGNVTPGHKKTIKLGVVKAELRVQLAEGGKPLANKKYILDVKDEHRTYKYRETDGNGLVKEMVPVNAKDVKLLVGEYKDNSFKPQYKFNLKINHIDPIDTVSGVQARLNNLGFECGEVTDINNTSTKEAVRAFQEKYKNDGLPANGDYKDKATQDKLKDVYGC